jgi:hypothetical protein
MKSKQKKTAPEPRKAKDSSLDKKIDRLMEEVKPHNKEFVEWLRKKNKT